MQYRKTLSKGPHTPASLGHKPIAGVPHLRAMERKRAGHKQLSVSRAYGGCLTHDLVRERCGVKMILRFFISLPSSLRIIRAFLIEEQKIVKRVLKAQSSRKKSRKSKAYTAFLGHPTSTTLNLQAMGE